MTTDAPTLDLTVELQAVLDRLSEVEGRLQQVIDSQTRTETTVLSVVAQAQGVFETIRTQGIMGLLRG